MGSRRRPAGDDVPVGRLDPWKKYRVPWDDKGHRVHPETLGLEQEPMFFCGRGVYANLFWTESGLEDYHGVPWYVVRDEREGQSCTECRTKAAAYVPKKHQPVKYVGPLNDTELASLSVKHQWERRRLEAAAANVASWLGGEVIE